MLGVIKYVGSPLEAVIYLLCVVTSLLCAFLLARAYIMDRRAKVLIWSAVCFGLLAFDNFVLAADVLLLPEVDLRILDRFTDLLAVSALLYGFIWDGF